MLMMAYLSYMQIIPWALFDFMLLALAGLFKYEEQVSEKIEIKNPNYVSIALILMGSVLIAFGVVEIFILPAYINVIFFIPAVILFAAALYLESRKYKKNKTSDN